MVDLIRHGFSAVLCSGPHAPCKRVAWAAGFLRGFASRGYPAYCASKGGIVQLTRALATAWAPDNIQVNSINPGWVDTGLTRNSDQQREGFVERVVARSPEGRWGTPGDFQGVAVFLAGGASDFVTGTAIVVDGGFSALG